MSGEPESFVELDVGRSLMVLRHEGDGCHLLTAECRCSVYAARPAPCAAYPFALSEATETAPVRHLFVLSDSPCQQSVAASDAVARKAVECVENELNAYVRVVTEWNRRQNRRKLAGRRARPADEFLTYLSEVAIHSSSTDEGSPAESVT